MSKIILEAQTDIPVLAFCNAYTLPSVVFSEETISQGEKTHHVIQFDDVDGNGHLDEALFTMWIYLEEDIPTDVLAFYAPTDDQVSEYATVQFSPINQQIFNVEQGKVSFTGFRMAAGESYFEDSDEYGEIFNEDGSVYTVASRMDSNIPSGQYLISVYPTNKFSNEQYKMLQMKNEQSIKQQFVSEFGEENYHAYMNYKSSNASLSGCLMSIIFPVLIFPILIAIIAGYGFIVLGAHYGILFSMVILVVYYITNKIWDMKKNQKDLSFKPYQERYYEIEDQYHDPYSVDIVATMRRILD